jgi:stage II sporulation protein D
VGFFLREGKGSIRFFAERIPMNTLITEEPKIKVGIMEQSREVAGKFNGRYSLHDGHVIDGDFLARSDAGQVVLFDSAGVEIARQNEIQCLPLDNSTFTLFKVMIGIRFHWERTQTQEFHGALTLILGRDGTLTAVNTLLLEDYLESVISSEMSAKAPIEFLKAHAITSRSWLMHLLQHQTTGGNSGESVSAPPQQAGEIIRWYGKIDHRDFDVCADDHCQRYQGISPVISGNARLAVRATRGLFLVSNGKICDARYHKACGGLTDDFKSAWENTAVSYLTSISDASVLHPPIKREEAARRWIMDHPAAYCNTRDRKILEQILPSFDQETSDFFRWKIVYDPQELKEIIHEKSGIDFGNILNITAVERGPSGRIIRLKIEGSKDSTIIGKELEIRRWLSRTHLYSSAFVVSTERDFSGNINRFVLYGAGWGHGIGLCQIGAAVMATQGYCAEDILKHYFSGAEIKGLY